MFARTAIAASRTSCTAFDPSSAAKRRRSNLAAFSGEGDFFISTIWAFMVKIASAPCLSLPAST